MLKQLARFMFCCGVIVAIMWVFDFTERGLEFSKQFRYFDKYEHAVAGILLMAGFFDRWKENWFFAFVNLLGINLDWEFVEGISAYFYPAILSVPVPSWSWVIDTVLDIATTMYSGMVWYFLSRKK